MTPKEIETDMKSFVNGSSFIRIGDLAKYLGQKNTNRVREKYTKDAFKLDGSPSYFIPDIAKNIYRAGLTLLLVFFLNTSQAQAQDNSFFEENGFQLMSTTAYCMGHHTANGSAVHSGGCACSPDRIGQVAIVYTVDGDFLGYYECNDTGAGGVRAGTVIDIYRRNLTQCTSYMKITTTENGSNKVFVKWIDGKG